ncbi:helix-turn-helix transcriptional regulator [Maliponia aquimaris]|uniref:HTH-type transcriptional regulator PuuR n=1 Tax=Maliponia aquimaris TaxID=1673631 RepID=A0A238L5X3_9RHOB|nr:helix-turn-helix transcriptional regulator [Maliponia aquimaris]SMX50513.1 HTH-type transcriptional regulator PuuR [Maliponia aquimaris]
MKSDLTVRLAGRLSALRAARGWTLDQLAAASGVSRAALSRLENAEVSPSADVLSRLAKAHDMTLSRLFAMIEDGFSAHVTRDEQPVWRDGETGLAKRFVSPAAAALAAEVVECKMTPNTDMVQDAPEVVGQEHHLLLLSGNLQVRIEGAGYTLAPGDALRYREHGEVRLSTDRAQGAKFMLVRVTT